MPSEFKVSGAWVQAVKALALQGVSSPDLLVYVLMNWPIELPAGRFDLGGGYPRAVATVAEALGIKADSVQDAYVATTARRSDAANLIARAQAALPAMRAALPAARIGVDEQPPPPVRRAWLEGVTPPDGPSQPRTIHFYRVNGPFGFLSNFARAPILLDGRRWPTSEHYFQAQKFTGIDEQERVRATASPMEAARLGRSLGGLRPDWDQVRDDVMLTALRAKFSQHPYLRSELLATDEATLVEHTENDHYWADGGDGSGKNRLGELLMQVRGEMRQHA